MRLPLIRRRRPTEPPAAEVVVLVRTPDASRVDGRRIGEAYSAALGPLVRVAVPVTASPEHVRLVEALEALERQGVRAVRYELS